MVFKAIMLQKIWPNKMKIGMNRAHSAGPPKPIILQPLTLPLCPFIWKVYGYYLLELCECLHHVDIVEVHFAADLPALYAGDMLSLTQLHQQPT